MNLLQIFSGLQLARAKLREFSEELYTDNQTLLNESVHMRLVCSKDGSFTDLKNQKRSEVLVLKY